MESACSRGTSADGWMSHHLRFRWMKRRYVGFWQRSGGKYGRADEIDKKRNGPLTKRFSSANRFRNAFTTCAPQMSSGGRRTSHNQVNRSVRQADEFCQFSQCVSVAHPKYFDSARIRMSLTCLTLKNHSSLLNDWINVTLVSNKSPSSSEITVKVSNSKFQSFRFYQLNCGGTWLTKENGVLPPLKNHYSSLNCWIDLYLVSKESQLCWLPNVKVSKLQVELFRFYRFKCKGT